LNDVTVQKQKENHLKASLTKKDTMIREIFHRVKNNFQMVSSLIGLQAESCHDEITIDFLKKCQNRINSMALVHEKLFRSPDLSHLDFRDYVQQLTSHLVSSYRMDAKRVSISSNITHSPPSMSHVLPCSLIINELVTNSLKHAFPNGKKGEIIVDLRHTENGNIALRVKDTGIGMPDSIDPEHTATLGLQLVSMLTEQIDGTMDIDRTNGTEITINFPEGQDA
jgi:two-component sensor histidine kinase